MISPDLIQKAVIKFLQADTALMSVLSGTNQVLELEYQGQDFVYPNIRVDIQPQTPIGNGTDRPKLSTIHWTTRVYSEQPSSREANYLLGLVIQATFNKQWVGTDYNDLPFFRLIRVDLASQDNAIRITDRLWVASAIFQSEVNPISFP